MVHILLQLVVCARMVFCQVLGVVSVIESRERVTSGRRWRGAPATSASIAANSFSMARADGAPSALLRCIASREFAVARERLLNAIGVAAAQRPRRMPRQQGLDLVSLFLIHGQPHWIPFALRGEEGT